MTITIIVSLSFFTLLLLYMFKEAYRNHINEITLHYEQFPETDCTLSIFFITDIHRRRISTNFIDQVVGKADLVIIGGDLTEKGVPLKRTKDNLNQLNRIGPIYFVWGNNDYEVHESEFRKLLIQNGVEILENRSVPIDCNGKKRVNLIGFGEVSFQLDSVWLALQNVDQDAFKIGVCHNPAILSKLPEDHSINLLLSGHTHGGQINFFGLSPYPKGRFVQTDRIDYLISNGYGTTMLPLRFWARAETHLIHIKGKTEHFS
ncbi:metallophosphoesterase [Fervidibacillus halotolerans]|uniref:Metallophosphoesterase n=1 Tax=Fervidibacillus halotolerans TaxID=2980027 RepID=A0A9E8M1L8_9BACI|nr:metallophosphoesterase [Fervidibacillus halotolerans]WAA13521.1 metallophosphoesterase [Fervidibacillus halotolerans]